MLLVWLGISLWTNSLYLRAALDPPPGRVFAGTFHWIDDFYNYASYAQQAEDGHFLLRNKLADPQAARPELVNLEWWLVGQISRVLGHRPFLAYRLLGVLVALAFVTGVERWLGRLGVPPTHRLTALGLVFFGGGLGGLLFEATDLPVGSCLDLSLGLFPFFELLANPHFALGTTLLVWALFYFSEVPAPWGPGLGVAVGTILGLVRPYDLGLLGLIRGVTVLATERPRAWLHSTLPLFGLFPALGYNLWLFFGNEQFTVFREGSPFPNPLPFAAALGPALLLALLSTRGGDRRTRCARVTLWSWVALSAALVAARPPAFSLQLMVGAGVPLLLLGAAGLRRFAPGWTALATLCLSVTAIVATRITLSEDPHWFVPRERLAAALALRDACGTTDRVLAPPDVSLYAIGHSACHAYVAHQLTPNYQAHLDATRAFYGSMPAAARSRMLQENRITRLVLPGFAGVQPVSWLGPDTSFRATAIVGDGPRRISIYTSSSASSAPQS